jgi:hypothetical protein
MCEFESCRHSTATNERSRGSPRASTARRRRVWPSGRRGSPRPSATTPTWRQGWSPILAADGHAVVERSDERAGAAATRRTLTRALGRLADSDAVERNGWGWRSGQTWQRLRVALDQTDAV